MRKIQPFQYDYALDKPWTVFSSIIFNFPNLEKPAEKGKLESLGQAFLKACRCPEGKALGRSSQWSKLLYAVRSAGVNLWNSPGDCFTKRGRSARESAPLKHSRYGAFFFLDNILGSAARNDVDRNISETVKKGENRQRMQAEGFALSTPTSPFLKGLTPKSMIL